MQIRYWNGVGCAVARSAAQLPLVLDASHDHGQLRRQIARLKHYANKHIPPKALVIANVFGGEKDSRWTFKFFEDWFAIVKDIRITVVKSQASGSSRNSSFLQFPNKPRHRDNIALGRQQLELLRQVFFGNPH